MDFGLAKYAGQSSPFAESENVSEFATKGWNLTTEGTIVGTLQYMSPEQLEGKETDARTDIFAFGTVPASLLSSTLNRQERKGREDQKSLEIFVCSVRFNILTVRGDDASRREWSGCLIPSSLSKRCSIRLRSTYFRRQLSPDNYPSLKCNRFANRTSFPQTCLGSVL